MPYIANPLEGLPIRNSFITDQANLGAAAASDDTIIIYDISATALKQLTIANMQAGILASPTFTGVPAGPTASAGTSTTQLATTAFVTTATTALNTIDEMTDTTIDSVGSGEVLKWSGSAWINNTLAQANILPVAGPTFTGVLTVGSAVISEADLELIDDLTAGTVVVSKAVTVDGNKDVGTIRNLTIDGVFTDGNYSFDTSGNVTGLGTIGSGNITSTGTMQGTTITATTAFVPDASNGAALGTTALEFSDLYLADGAVIYFGVDQDVNITHVADTGLTTDKDFSVGDDLTVLGGVIDLKSNSGSAGLMKFYCESSNAHAQTLQGQPHSASATNVLLLPTGGNSTLVSLESTDVLTNKTLTAPSINGVVGGTATSQTITTLTSTTTNAGTLAAAAGSITDSSGAISFDNENLTTTGTLASGAITSSAIIKTDSTTNATSTTDGSLQTDGGLSVVLDAVFGDDVKLLSDSAVLSFGADSDTTLTHTDGVGLGLNSTNKITFNDVSQFIQGASNEILALGATAEIDLTATLVDLNGNLDVSGTLTQTGVATFAARSVHSAGVTIADAGEIGSATDPNAITISSGGVIAVTATTASSSATTGALTVAGGAGVAADLFVGDDVGLISDGAILSFGASSEVTLTHVADDGLLLNTDMQLQFRDSAINIRSDADGDLDINADDEIELNSTLIDINGAVDISGTLTMSGDTLDMSGEDIDNIRSATFITEVANGATGGTMTIDWGAGQKQSVVLSNNTAFTFTAPDGPCNLMLKVTHAANTTTYTPTWAGGSTNVDWPAATAPTFTQTSGSVDIVAFYYDGTNANGTYYGQASLAMG